MHSLPDLHYQARKTKSDRHEVVTRHQEWTDGFDNG